MCLPKGTFIPDAIYFRGNATVSNGKLIIPKGETITFDTYFNMFPLFKWRRYTRIADLYVNVRLQGNARIELRGINRSKDDATKFDDPITLNSVEFQNTCINDTTLLQCGNLDDLADFIYLSIHAESEVTIEGIDYSTSAQRSKDLNIACCFCTYKREADIKKNVENLLVGIVHNEESDLKDRLHIYVADNGHTLPLDLYAKEPAVHLFYNKNYGGAGGFTRCMIETCFRNEGKPFSHIILMDDDALILPEVVERTGALLSILKEEYCDYMVGGALMAKENPVLQRTNGEFLQLYNHKRTMRGKDNDMTQLNNVLMNEISPESDVNYNGWWYSCIPSKVITKDNLPLPLFLHGDDQEYGIRNGGRFLRINGVCAWHPRSTGSSIARPFLNYYSRNSLIVEAKYFSQISIVSSLKKAFKMSLGPAFGFQYQGSKFNSMAFNHFYMGIDSFKRIDPEQLNNNLRKCSSVEQCQLSADELKGIHITIYKDSTSVSESTSKKKMRKMLNWIVPAFKGRVVYDNSDLEWESIDMFGVKEICLVNPETGKGLIFRKSYKQMFKALGRAISDTIMVARRHKRVFKEWHEGIPELTSYAFWQKYLDIETEKQSYD